MSGNRIVANQVQDKGLSFLRKQESRHVNIPGFRIKCGMTTQKPNSRIYTLTIRANLRNPRLEIDSIIHPYFAKQSQFIRYAYRVMRIAKGNPEASSGQVLLAACTVRGFVNYGF